MKNNLSFGFKREKDRRNKDSKTYQHTWKRDPQEFHSFRPLCKFEPLYMYIKKSWVSLVHDKIVMTTYCI